MGKGPWERKESEAGGRGDRWQGPGHVQMRTVMQTGPHRHAVCGVCSIKHREPLARVFPATEFLIRFFYSKTLPLHGSRQSFPPAPPAPPPSPSLQVQRKQKEVSTTMCDSPAGPQSPEGCYCADMESKGPEQWGTMRPVQPPRRETIS